MTVVQHSSETNEHYTPREIVRAARRTMGGIDLDPASCAAANVIVAAKLYYDQSIDGLTPGLPWEGHVFLNPPGGMLQIDPATGAWHEYVRGVTPEGGKRPRSAAAVWWERLVSELAAGHTTAAVFVGFTLEILRSSQECALPVQAFARCYPKQRIAFGGRSPTHANVIVGVNVDYDAFAREFAEFGFCERGAV